MVAPVVGRQEGRHGGATPTRGRCFQGGMHPVDPALTSDRGAETLLTFPLNSYALLIFGCQSVSSIRGEAVQPPALG
ncbi:hypothetical protein [Prochlorothrix hollandica]|uniref:hypothetical protein n=1 Tax=Prochlorothrix hollandica TaxID=1223 RepID=UPI0012B51261|nr:hypothetical protein [Prochlorothrix hollandica]